MNNIHLQFLNIYENINTSSAIPAAATMISERSARPRKNVTHSTRITDFSVENADEIKKCK